ncbi:MAG TPA: cupin domain-containing protein [Stellaceae bacterium]|nr:cupin domain-containing protein [Stellaceae bacterium]
MSATGKSTTPDHIRQAWKEAHVAPLWEQLEAHSTEVSRDRAYIWKWQTMKPLIEDALAMQDMAAIQRRVLTFSNPNLRSPNAMGATPTLTAALQILKPGEVARPHRHSPSALRFVLEGGGAYTIVDGKECLMEEGDLVITPGWTWHAHEHRGNRPIIWLDSLDVPLHRYFGTDGFEPGPPPNDMPPTTPDATFAVANIVPEGVAANPQFSPVFRYPWEQAVAALASAPVAKDGVKRVRYVNPMNGGPCMSLMDCYLFELGDGETLPVKSSASMVCAVVEGTGTTQAGDDTIAWEPKDVFSLPTGATIRHRANGKARIFAVSDREVLRRLDLLEEKYGATA